jgi:hypothetical protein
MYRHKQQPPATVPLVAAPPTSKSRRGCMGLSPKQCLLLLMMNAVLVILVCWTPRTDEERLLGLIAAAESLPQEKPVHSTAAAATANVAIKKNQTRLEQLRDVCGELCDTNRPSRPSPWGYIDAVTAEVNCLGLFETDLLDQPDASAPRTLPPNMVDDFTMNGRVSVEPWYIKDIYLGKKAKTGSIQQSVWKKQDIDEWILKARNKDFETWGNYYTIDRSTLLEALQFANLTQKTVLVLGSESPWVEALCLAAGAQHVTTLEYGTILSEHPQVDTLVPREFREAYLAGRLPVFDVVVSYSSLEHSGLGRYGDSLNPWGDIMSLARAWCVTKNHGKLVLGVSTGPDRVYMNSNRVYGPLRWPYLASNWIRMNYSSGWWKRNDILTWKPPIKRYKGPPGCEIWRNQSSFVFQKTGPPGSPEESFVTGPPGSPEESFV